MEIKRVAPQPPPKATAVDSAAPTKAFADKLESTANTSAPDVSKTLDHLLDRAADRMGGLPADAREALKSQLSTDPFFQSRLTRYLEKQGE